MEVAIIGSGYVGLTTAVTLAYIGHNVMCIDVDETKINLLKKGKCHFFEPHLEELLVSVRARLNFTTSSREALAHAQVVFIAVGTPPLPDGSPDLRYVRAAAREIGNHVNEHLMVVVNKSTVPIGSGNLVGSLIHQTLEENLEQRIRKSERVVVASNPEFLREGSALHDSLYPDRIVIGANDSRASNTLFELYRPILEQTFEPPENVPRPESLGAVPLLVSDLASAELIKYAANAFLSLKISYINEIAELAERVGADISQVAKGIGLDSRIGGRFLQAGIGWGGSCFSKDTSALVTTGHEYGLPMRIVRAARDVNSRQRERIVEKLLSELKILRGATIGLLGLAFKPNTDDLRDAPALDIGSKLLERGARVKAFDPVALVRARSEEGTRNIEFCDTPNNVALNADALVLITEWPTFQHLDWDTIGSLMRTKIIIDGRNMLNRERLAQAGFRVVGMGR